MSTLRKFDDDHVWRKSSKSGGNAGTCLYATTDDGQVGIRDSKQGDHGSHLWMPDHEWAVMLNALHR